MEVELPEAEVTAEEELPEAAAAVAEGDN